MIERVEFNKRNKLVDIYHFILKMKSRQHLATCHSNNLIVEVSEVMRSREVSYVSFDIFDTLVERKDASPEDITRKVIEGWSIYLNSKGFSFMPNELYLLRRKIELELRNENLSIGGDGEAHISNIISRLVNILCSEERDTIAKDLLKIEVSAEINALSLREGIYEVLSYLYRNNVKLYAISDMYLDINSIEEILTKLDIYNFFSKIFVSSEYSYLKGTGNLFEEYLSNVGAEPERCIHIGDNYVSDVLGSAKKNINSIYIKKEKHVFLSKKIISNYSQRKLNSNLMKYDFFNGLTDLEKYVYMHIYFTCFLYIEKLSEEAFKYRKKIIFIAREGIVLKHFFDEYCRLNSLDLESDILFLSRECFNFNDIKRGEHRYQKEISESHNQLDNLKVCHEHILNLKGYLSSFDFSDAILADVGWGGSIEKYIRSFVTQPIRALYYGVDKRYYNPFGDGVIFSKKNQSLIPDVYRGFGVFEAFLTPLDFGTTITFTKINDIYRPVYARNTNVSRNEMLSNEMVNNMLSVYCSFRNEHALTTYDIKLISQHLFRSFTSNPRKDFVDLVHDFDTGSEKCLVKKVSFTKLIYIKDSIWIEGSLEISGLKWCRPLISKLIKLARTEIVKKVIKRFVKE